MNIEIYDKERITNEPEEIETDEIEETNELDPDDEYDTYINDMNQ